MAEPSARGKTASTFLQPLHFFLFGSGSWFVSNALQAVLFAWLVTIVLRESPAKVGIAQMTLLLPGLFLLLIGGGLADRFGRVRVAASAQAAAAIPPILLAVALWLDAMSFSALLIYAFSMGTAQAFLTPARDGMLNLVAAKDIQRGVLVVNQVQYLSQLFGFALAAFADSLGAAPVLLCQAAVLLVGSQMFRRLRPLEPPPQSTNVASLWTSLWHSIREGAGIVRRSPAIWSVMWVNIATGMCFMGSYIVTLPLLVREAFAGSSTDLAILNTANVIGLMTTVAWLLRRGQIQRKGRALISAHLLGVAVFVFIAMATEFWWVAGLVYLWGASGGIAMSMARTIAQELAPEGMQARVMAFFSLSFFGAGPLGALGLGLIAEAFGTRSAILAACATMGLVMAWTFFQSNLWRYRFEHQIA